ncbi:Arylsulfatase [Planctomycetes bacterium Pan216]|uniref:Arylsulfatase n=1 Tax=Kolteria novifilia TaxID=2527975 RepID=A0A518B4K9_9BACT|nr:Arylsulfatase [Planctomycetes bacterium Pan216]
MRWCRALAVLCCLAVAIPVGSRSALAEAARPNIVWIVVEDMSADFRCYGQKVIETPNVDRLAKQGVKFTNAVVTAPVCSACRSALVTGMYQTSIGAHQHRSGRGEKKIHLPDFVVPVPELFQKADYHVNNLSFGDFVRSEAQVKKNPKVKTAKTDYNFESDPAMYDATHWAARKPGQPFFCQVQLRGGKLRGPGDGEKWPKQVEKTLGSRTDPSRVTLPPYLPDDPVIREDWAQYLDTVRYTDWEVGKILERLEQAGVLDQTYIYFLTDHGISHVRNKQYLYDGGMHVPLIVKGPAIEPASVREDPVEQIDLGASSLVLAGVGKPAWMQGRDIFAADYVPRDYAVSARDRCDETVDRIRALRSPRWKYIRNFHPERPYLAPNRYKDNKPILQAMRRRHASGQLNAEQARIMADTRPEEELYDLKNDPYEATNLAESPDHALRLISMRRALSDWVHWSGDRGQQTEPEGMYDSDMAVYLKALERRQPEGAQEIRDNIAQMKAWAAEGK